MPCGGFMFSVGESAGSERIMSHVTIRDKFGCHE